MRIEEKLGVTLLKFREELSESGLIGLANRLCDICYILIHFFCCFEAELVTLGSTCIEFLILFNLRSINRLLGLFKCILDLAEKAIENKYYKVLP
jgi:hypothetical protein